MTAADLIWVFVELAFFEVIYQNTFSINGWSRDQTYFFLGVFIACDSLFTIFFQRAFWTLPYMINHGDLDILLTKPVSAIFLATFRDINFSQGVNLIIGFFILHHYGAAAGFQGGTQWLLLLFWMAVGLTAQYLLRFFFVIWTFWLERGITVSRLYYQFYALANKPAGLYPNAIRYLLKTALPFAFLGSVPAESLMGRESPGIYIQVIAILGAYGLLIAYLWRAGLRRYQSASS